MPTQNKQRLTILKVIALLLQVRWYNIALLALAQYFASVFVMNDMTNWKQTLFDYKLHLIVLASLLIIAGGFIINNFYDREKDLINRPKQTLFERLISKGTSLNLYFTFNLTGLLLAYVISWRAFLFYAAFAFGLWLYSHKMKKIMGLGNFTAAFLAVMPFFGIFFYYDAQGYFLMLYVFMMVAVIFSREIVKDMLGIKGDLIYDYPTIPATLGFKSSKLFVILGLGIIPFLSLIMISNAQPALKTLLVVANTVVFVALFMAAIAKTTKDFERVNMLLKAIIIGGVFSLIFFRL
jgi:4-hydroxybenzoate polyprenyltransferase